MDQILRDLGALLLKAVPTFLLVGLLYFYLKRMFFRPLDRVLEARQAATEGARQAAGETFAKAAEKTAQCEAALRAARAEIYREQERLRQQWRQEQAVAVEEARRKAHEMLGEAEVRLHTELVEAKHDMEWGAELLATVIAERVLARRVM